MSENQVSYTMSLRDMLTGKIKEADGAINHMEGSLSSLKGGLIEFGKTAIASLGVLASAEFFHQSLEAFNEQAQAMGQLNTALESTRGISGMTSEALVKQAEALQKVTLYGDEATEQMDSILLTFTNIRGEIFNNTVPLIQDLSTRMGQDLKSSAVQVGKALNDPIKGITALQRVGVSFTESQKELIKHLAVTGHMAEAQKLILQELQIEFGGSAMAAAEMGTGPLTVLKNAFNDVQEEVGELVMGGLRMLIPAMQAFTDIVRGSVRWIKEHAAGLKSIALGLGIAVGALTLYKIGLQAAALWQGILTGATQLGTFWQIAIGNAYVVSARKTGLMTAAQWALNAAMEANPIGILIGLITAFTAAIIWNYNHMAVFRAGLWGTWETVKEFGRLATDVFSALWHVVHGVFNLNGDEVSKGLLQGLSAMTGAGARLGAAFKKGAEDGLHDFLKDQSQENAPKTLTKKAIGSIAPPSAGKKETAKTIGNKSISITINIGSLIKDFQIKTTNITEGMGQIKEKVSQSLLSAVNDSQIISGM